MTANKFANPVRNEEGIATAISVLQQQFGESLKTGDSIREQHSHSTTYIAPQLPDAVVFATSTEEVSQVVKVCAQYKVPVIAFGTGTSLEGGVNAPMGGICIDLNGMDQIIEVNSEDLDCRVQAGVTREALNEYLRDTGLFFPIDPGANASLGGMAATRASGTNAVRYGTMRENVINITAVMPNGDVVTTSKRAKKSSAGYDLTRLLVGSEGTLGIITELSLRLYGIPEAITAAICSFDDVQSACNTTIMAMQMGMPVARIELLDETMVEAINAYSGVDFPLCPLLMLEFHGSTEGVKEQTEMFGSIADELGGTGFRWVSELSERNKLWKARHDAYWAIKAMVGDKQTLSTDVCVPISRLADCVMQTAEDIKEAGLFGPIVGHVGDGNFHCAIAFDGDDSEEIARMEAVVNRLAKRAIEMEGTCTGEHGIGQGKQKFMRLEHGAGIDIMQAIKMAIDPDNIMNPSKVLSFNS